MVPWKQHEEMHAVPGTYKNSIDVSYGFLLIANTILAYQMRRFILILFILNVLIAQ